MLEQISIYTENRKGAAREIFSLLAEENINVLSFVNSDGGEFGAMRLIVSDPKRASDKLKAKGYFCKNEMVIAAELDDVPGALEKLLKLIEDMNVNIRYMYVGYRRENRMPVIIIRCDDRDIVASALTRNGYTIH